MSNVGEMQIFRKKAETIEAIQFTGKNGKAVVEFIKERTNRRTRNGGTYVQVFFDEYVVRDEARKCTIKKGEFICWSGDEIVVRDEEALRATHVINKNHALL